MYFNILPSHISPLAYDQLRKDIARYGRVASRKVFSTRAGLRERPVPTAEQTNGLWGGAYGNYGSDRGTRPKHDERGTLRHLCIVARHRVRMVRFLPVRDPRT